MNHPWIVDSWTLERWHGKHQLYGSVNFTCIFSTICEAKPLLSVIIACLHSMLFRGSSETCIYFLSAIFLHLFWIFFGLSGPQLSAESQKKALGQGRCDQLLFSCQVNSSVHLGIHTFSHSSFLHELVITVGFVPCS